MTPASLWLEPEAFRQMLGAMGFVRGRGFTGEVWTNPDGPLAQVWLCLDETAVKNYVHRPNASSNDYDATPVGDKVNFTTLFAWLIERHDAAQRSSD